mgnify:CR=1 FL=1
MSFRYFGKETAEYRTQPTGEGIDHAAVFAYFHHAEPEGEYSCQSQGYFKSVLEEEKVELTSSVNISTSPIKMSLQRATMNAMTKNATQM